MSEPFVGEIRMFAGNFAPRGWAFCDRQLLAVSQNDALFSLYGTIYGGDGRTTFGLPDMRGRIPLHEGNGPGLSNRRLGAKGGEQSVHLTVAQIPSHHHGQIAVTAPATSVDPAGRVVANTEPRPHFYPPTSAAEFTAMQSGAITNSGGTNSHNNMMPYLCVNFIVALVGIYPSRH